MTAPSLAPPVSMSRSDRPVTQPAWLLLRRTVGTELPLARADERV
jgi:hypothetical protein